MFMLAEPLMRRTLLKSKIHRVTITDANVDYEGSVTIDKDLMAAADILPYEMVHIWNLKNGERIVTYAIPGKGEREVCLNGAAAYHAKVGDPVIIASFGEYEDAEVANHTPKKIRLGYKNETIGS